MSILNTMEGYPLAAEGRTEINYHRLIESYKFGFAQRSLYGDPIDPVFRNISKLANEFVRKEASEGVRRRINDVSHITIGWFGRMILTIGYLCLCSRKRSRQSIMNPNLPERRIMALYVVKIFIITSQVAIFSSLLHNYHSVFRCMSPY